MEGGTTGMAGIVAALDSVLDFLGKILGFIMENPLLIVLLAFGLAGSAIAVLKKMKSFASSR